MILSLPRNTIVWRPLLLTLLLHTALLLALTANWSSRNQVAVKPQSTPRFVEARLIDADSLKPKKKPLPETRSEPQPTPLTSRTTTGPVSKPEPAPAKPPPKPVQSEPKPVEPVEPVPVRISAEERAAAARAELSMALEAEDILLKEAGDQRLTSGYLALMAQIIQDNWSRPPSARNEMETELVIQLIPTGEVVSVTVVRGSGLAAFDRSAVMAVQKAGKFPELQRLPSRLFEKNFRRLRLKFKPEDLRY